MRTVSMLDDIFLAARCREECLQALLELLALLRGLGLNACNVPSREASLRWWVLLSVTCVR